MKLIVLDAAQAELEEAQAYYLHHATPGVFCPLADGVQIVQGAIDETAR